VIPRDDGFLYHLRSFDVGGGAAAPYRPSGVALGRIESGQGGQGVG
jgi:hypothetical protein